MAEEMILENVPWESDEAEDWESDEAVPEADEAMAEAEDTAEDIGEARRRRGRPRRWYRPGRGVQGLRMRGPDGAVRQIAFPRKLATAAETNRSLARQAVRGRALEGQLDRLETRLRAQQKNDSSVSGTVTLLIAGGLTAWGAVAAARQSAGFTIGNWAKEDSTKMATLLSVSQLATSGAGLAFNRRYHRSGFGVAADGFAAAQLAAFAFGTLYQPAPAPPIKPVDNEEQLKALVKAAGKDNDGDLVYETTSKTMYVLRATINNGPMVAIPIHQH
jgi:hypothetical protein